MKSLLILISLILIALEWTQPNRILIRHDTPDEEYIAFAKSLPVTASIVFYNNTDLAGTLISEQWVLSAAHVAETIPEGHKLIIGNDSVGIEKIIIHPEWSENGRPDIALIKLNRAINHIKPVRLYTEQEEIGKEVIVAGIGDFGTGKTGVEGKAGTMRAATNIVDGISNDSQYIYWLFDDPESNRVTALEGISGPGDSAGPAFIKSGDEFFLAGVGSAQSTRATDGVEGLYGVTEYYTRVSTFIDWINEEKNK